MARSSNAEREAREARDRLRRYTARQSVHDSQVKRRRRDNILAIVGAVVVAALAAFTQVLYFTAGPGAPEEPEPIASPTSQPDPTTGENIGNIPDPSLAENRSWTGTLSLNDVTLDIQLDGQAAPQTVAVFVQEVRNGYFEGKSCHRLTVGAPGLLQCGSEDGTGASSPDFRFGPIENAPMDNVYPAGTIAMARVGGAAYSQGHQFFIMYEEGTIPSDAAGGYTVFGTVTGGLDELRAQIADAGTADGSQDGAPKVPTTITGVTIQ